MKKYQSYSKITTEILEILVSTLRDLRVSKDVAYEIIYRLRKTS